MDKLKGLLETKAISRFEYLTYLVFQGDDVGKEYLAMRVDMAFMEEPDVMGGESILWHDGRKANWREIKFIIKKIERLIEQGVNENG